MMKVSQAEGIEEKDMGHHPSNSEWQKLGEKSGISKLMLERYARDALERDMYVILRRWV